MDRPTPVPPFFSSPIPSAQTPAPSATTSSSSDAPDTAGSPSNVIAPPSTTSDADSPPQTFTAAPLLPAPATAGDTDIPNSCSEISELQHSRSEVQTTPAPPPTPDPEQLRQLEVLDALAQGMPYREICRRWRIGMASLIRIAKRQAELDAGAVSNLMKSKTLDMLETWESAAKIGALRGKHTPAKDWLLHAKALEPVREPESPSVKIAIVLGMPGQTLATEQPQVIDTTVVAAKDGE